MRQEAFFTLGACLRMCCPLPGVREVCEALSSQSNACKWLAGLPRACRKGFGPIRKRQETLPTLGACPRMRCPLPTIPDKRVGTPSRFSPPMTFIVDNQVIFFPFLMEKTRYYPTLIRGDGGCVIQLKCLNYFWPGYSERNMRGNATGCHGVTIF